MNSLTASLGQCLLVVAGGALLGVAVNAARPDGLDLARNHFPSSIAAANVADDHAPLVVRVAAPAAAPLADTLAAPAPVAAGAPPAVPADPAAQPSTAAFPPEWAAVAQRLAGKGFSALTFDEVRALHEDPAFAAGAYLFVDARDDEQFEAGHIPGAVQLDPYHIERYLDAVMAAVPGCLRIVVYCTGGKCEDSEFAATDLASLGVPTSQLAVYVGGIEDWAARGMPMQTGR